MFMNAIVSCVGFNRDSRVAEDGWINVLKFPRKAVRGVYRYLLFSPSGRHVIIPISFKNCRTKILIYDVVKRKVAHVILRHYDEFLYWYWLDNTTICIIAKNVLALTINRFIYKCNFDNYFRKLKIIDSCAWSMGNPNWQDLIYMEYFSPNNCRLTIHGHEFILSTLYKWEMLLPYNPMSMGPQLPPLDINLRGMDRDYLFTYKNTMYLRITVGSSFLNDRFRQIKVKDFDLERREVNFDNDHDSVLFFPTKLNAGSYKDTGMDKSVSTRFLWQDGATVLFHDYEIVDKFRKTSKIWILDMEKGTILEKQLGLIKFSDPTIFKNYLCMWAHPYGDSKITWKFFWIGNKTPKLADICIVKLLSQDKIHPFVSKVYDQMIHN